MSGKYRKHSHCQLFIGHLAMICNVPTFGGAKLEVEATKDVTHTVISYRPILICELYCAGGFDYYMCIKI